MDTVSYEDAVGGGSSSPQTVSYEDAIGAPKNAGPLSNAADEGWASGAAKGAATATIKGLANIPGMFGNIREFGNYLGDRAYAAATGKPIEEVQAAPRAHSWLPSWASPDVLPTGQQLAAPVLAKTGEYTPESEIGKIAQTGLETAVSSLGPGSGALVRGAAPRVALTTSAKMAPGAAIAGGAGQAATDITGDPIWGMAASLLAPGIASASHAGASKVARPMMEDIPWMGRHFAGEREGMAGEQLLSTADNPQAVKESLFPAQGPANLETIKGSRPTTGQMTGDMGLLQAERQAKTSDNTSFNDIEAQQNTARRAALEGVAPQGADVMRPSQIFQEQKAALDQSMDAAHQRLRDHAANLAGAMGDAVPAEQIGSQLRTAIEDVRGQEKKAVSKLYQAVDPDGTMTLVSTPLREGAEEVQKSIDTLGAPPSADVSRILEKMTEAPDVLPFKSIMALDTDITDAMRREKRSAGESNDHRLLSQLKGQVQGAISNAIDNQHAWEQARVAKGDLAPENTMEANLQKWVDDFRTQQRAVATGSEGAGEYPDARTRPAAGVSGTAGAAGRRPSGAPSGEGISPAPNFDDASAERLGQAKSAYAEYAKTYKAQPVAGAIKTTGFTGQYAAPSSAVPARAIIRGDKGYETASAFLKAAKNAPDAVSAMQDAALNQLRSRVKPDGTVDAKAVADWKKQYSGALMAVDERKPGFSASFDKAGEAADKLAEFGETRQALEREAQKSAAAKFIGLTDPREVENRIGQMLKTPRDGVTQMRQLLKQAKSDPAAVEGLRKAAIDYVARKFSNVAESGTTEQKLLSSASFQKLVRDFEPNLSVLFKPEQINTLRAIAKDLEMSDRSVQATRVKGSPGSAKDILPFLSKGQKEGLTQGSMLLAIVEGLKEAHERGGMKGVATLGVPIAALAGFHYWRGNAIGKVQNLVRAGLEDPSIAQRLIMKIQPERVNAQSEIVSKMIRRGLIAAPIAKANEEREQRAAGGRISSKDYPAKRASHIEKLAKRNHEQLAHELRPLMSAPDNVIVDALRLAKH